MNSSLNKLETLRNQYSPEASQTKLSLLSKLEQQNLKKPADLIKLHQTACFLRAFPDNKDILDSAARMLENFPCRLARLSKDAEEGLFDSGISGTALSCIYSFETARWLCKNFPKGVEIDWEFFEEPENVNDLLMHLVSSSEEQTFVDEDQSAFGEELTAQRWIEFAKGPSKTSALDWLLKQFPKRGASAKYLQHFYDNANVPIRWKLSGKHSSISSNHLKVRTPTFRTKGLRKRPKNPCKQIASPLTGAEHLGKAAAKEAIDTGIAMLVARHREVYSLRQPNVEEVYKIPLGEGAHVILIGLNRGYRMSIETNYTFYITANGTPIGYGGVTPLFYQANTGLSVFPEFRGGESAALFAQSLRAFHSLLGCSRFIANPYQIGDGNDDALNSGAYWFYYKLGFMPSTKKHQQLAKKLYSAAKLKRSTSISKRDVAELCSQPIHLRLPGDKAANFFDERWLGTIAVSATQLISSQGEVERQKAIRKIVSKVSKELGIRSRGRWPIHEKVAFEEFAPIVGLIPNLSSWPSNDKRELVQLMRAKGKASELEYSKRLRGHDMFRKSLLKHCKEQRRKGKLV